MIINKKSQNKFIGLTLSVLMLICLTKTITYSITAQFGGFTIDSTKIAQTLSLRFTTRYLEFNYSKAFTDVDTIKAHSAIYDRYFDDVIRDLDLPRPSKRIRCFIYSSSQEMQNCIGIDGGGWAIIDQIHTLGLFPIQHEGFHILFNTAIGLPKSAFFIEGIGQYYELSRDTQMVRRDSMIVRKYSDQPIELWANGTKNFWDSPREGWITVTYSISGVFVRRLIQQFGLPRFKEFYRLTDNNTSTSIEDGFNKIFGISLQEYVKRFSSDFRTLQQ